MSGRISSRVSSVQGFIRRVKVKDFAVVVYELMLAHTTCSGAIMSFRKCKIPFLI